MCLFLFLVLLVFALSIFKICCKVKKHLGLLHQLEELTLWSWNCSLSMVMFFALRSALLVINTATHFTNIVQLPPFTFSLFVFLFLKWVFNRQHTYVQAKSPQSCPILWDPMGCSPPGSSVHGILQARILESVATPSSKGSSNPGVEPVSPASPALVGRFFTTEPPGKSRQHILEYYSIFIFKSLAVYLKKTEELFTKWTWN